MPPDPLPSTPDPLSAWGNIASVFGLIVSVVGFVWTIVGVRRSKQAAQAARAAADRASKEIFRASAMVELGAATASLEEIKRLQRDGSWPGLLDRYSTLRATLISIRASRADLGDEHRTEIQNAITYLRQIENSVERALAKGQQPSAVKLNAVISDQLDRLSEVLGSLRNYENGS